MSAKPKTTRPKRKSVTPPAPRKWSVFSYFPEANCTMIERLFDEHKSYSDEKRSEDSITRHCKAKNKSYIPTPIIERFFADDLLEKARNPADNKEAIEDSVKAIRTMNQLLRGSIMEDPAILERIKKLNETGSISRLQEIFALKKRSKQKSFSLPHLGLFIDIYKDVVFLRELLDRLNNDCDDPKWGLIQILWRLRLVGTIKKHRQWIDAIFVDKKFKDAKLRAAFIYGDITGWKSIHKYIPKYLCWKSIQPALHKHAIEEARITADAWLKAAWSARK